MTESISFERAAGFYEATRGGLDRGARFARVMAPFIPSGSRVLEIGVGTGAIATPVRDLGHTVLGLDLSPAMLRLAHERLGNRIAVADATRMPIASASCDAVSAIWVFHLVGDQAAAAAEVGRVLRPGGRLLVGGGDPVESEDDMTGILTDLKQALRRNRDTTGRLDELAAGAGLTRVHLALTDPYEFDESPEACAQRFERREWSSCWDLDDETWAERVQPAIDRLRGLPGPERPRRRTHRNHLYVYERR